MGRHQRGPQQRRARRDRRVHRDVGVDAGVEERLPQQRRLEVLADDDRDDRGRGLAAVREASRARSRRGRGRGSPGAGSGRSRAACAISSGPSARMTRSAPSAAPTAAGTAEAVKMNGREAIAQVLDHLGRAGDEAAAGGEALREGAHPQVDLRPRARTARRCRRRARRARRPRAPRRPSAGRRSARQSSTIAGRSQRSPSIEKTPSTTTSTPPPSPAARSSILSSFGHLVVAEGAQLGAREHAAVEDRGVVGRVADHRVARARGSSRCSRRWPGGRW